METMSSHRSLSSAAGEMETPAKALWCAISNRCPMDKGADEALPRRHDTPSIETERLILRAHRAGDLADCAAMWADPAVTRYVGGTPASPEQTWHKMLRYAGLWTLLGYGYWAIEEKTTQRFVGELGFADFKRDIEPAFAGLPEIGWALAPFAQHRGYAGEAVRAAVGWSDANIDARRTIALIAAENTASLRIAITNGYGRISEITYLGEPTLIFRRDASATAVR
jgi:RimJ/RimL family protein N-acetyltransferase